MGVCWYYGAAHSTGHIHNEKVEDDEHKSVTSFTLYLFHTEEKLLDKKNNYIGSLCSDDTTRDGTRMARYFVRE